MNALLKRLLFAACMILAAFPAAVSAQSFTIADFQSNLLIKSDGRVLVTERIVVDFSEDAHGIYRDIPIRYERDDGSTHYTSISVTSVDDGSAPHIYEISENRSRMRIKIGDADRYVSGRQVYEIEYAVSGVILPYDGYDELYWNVTGSEWEALIERASATVQLPDGEIFQASCYQGAHGSNDSCVTEFAPGDSRASFSSEGLFAREGMTVAVGFTKGVVPIVTVEGPEPYDVARVIRQFLMTFVPLAGTIAFFGVWLSRRGRDSYYERKSLHDPDSRETTMPFFTRETIVVEYESPLKLRPAEIGVVMDERADTLDVSATIVDLATRGYLTITEVEKTWIFGSKDYVLTSTMKSPADLLEYERHLLNKLFEGRTEIALSDLKETFYASLSEVKTKLYEEVVAKKLFYTNPETTRNWYRVIGIVILVLGGFGSFASFGVTDGEPAGWALGITVAMTILGLVITILAGYMPRRTAKGREVYRQARGYQMFVSGTEQYRQPFFEKQNIFMEVLPYAMVFGVTSMLAKAMKDMGIVPQTPAWYVGTTPFNFVAFNNSMGTFEKSLSTAISSAPSSSGSGGGGFSGGGFGGGGGGSW